MMHLGHRVGALIDGQLGPAEEERAWSHVHSCGTCRVAVEREGWVKRQLVTLSLSDQGAAPQRLKGSLCGQLVNQPTFAPYPREASVAFNGRDRRINGLGLIGVGSVGVAILGVLAFGAAPAQTPSVERRLPTAIFPRTPAAEGPFTEPAPGPLSGPASIRSTAPTNREAANLIRVVVSTWRMGL
jgi:hypothetical protein